MHVYFDLKLQARVIQAQLKILSTVASQCVLNKV